MPGIAVPSRRLNYNLRYGITKAAVDDLYDAATEEMNAADVALQKEVHALVYTEDVLAQCRSQSAADQLRLPFGVAVTIRASNGGSTVVNIFGFECYRGMTHTVASDELFRKAHELATASQALRDKKFALEMALRDLMNTCATTKQLLEVWPDGRKYVEAVTSEDTSGSNDLVLRRRLSAAKIANIFLDEGIDVITETEVENAPAQQDQAA